uniref:Uncharacterized protein n=1 Tax=Rhizophora mucronata TaxID=61149 RepID=A0A2P2P012_RHIMU
MMSTTQIKGNTTILCFFHWTVWFSYVSNVIHYKF